MERETEINNQVEILKSRTLAEEIVDRLKKAQQPEQFDLLKAMDAGTREEDLVEVEGKLFTIITKCQDTMRESVGARHACHAVITQFDHAIEEYPILIAKMQEKKVQLQQPTQNLQMMREEPREEDPNFNIVL